MHETIETNLFINPSLRSLGLKVLMGFEVARDGSRVVLQTVTRNITNPKLLCQ